MERATILLRVLIGEQFLVFFLVGVCVVVLEVPAATQGVWEGSSGVRVSTLYLYGLI